VCVQSVSTESAHFANCCCNHSLVVTVTSVDLNSVDLKRVFKEISLGDSEELQK
jgi:hypothetical protein